MGVEVPKTMASRWTRGIPLSSAPQRRGRRPKAAASSAAISYAVWVFLALVHLCRPCVTAVGEAAEARGEAYTPQFDGPTAEDLVSIQKVFGNVAQIRDFTNQLMNDQCCFSRQFQIAICAEAA